MTHLRHGPGILRTMGQPQATLDIDDTGFAVTSEAGQSTRPWRRVQKVRRCPGFWLLMFLPSQLITIPLDGLPESMQAEFLARVQQHGGKAR